MSAIFVSYRRADSSGYAGRLFDRLAAHFGRDRVFIDLDSISFGEDFVEAIEHTLQGCEVVLAVIGPGWLSVTDASGNRRLDNESDHVLIEIRLALESGKRVVPVLVGGAEMPSAAQLPDVISRLARRNAIDISDRRFNHDAELLIQTLAEHLDAKASRAAGPVRVPDPPIEAPPSAPRQREERGGEPPPPSVSRKARLVVPAVLVTVFSVVLLFAVVWGWERRHAASEGAMSKVPASVSSISPAKAPAGNDGAVVDTRLDLPTPARAVTPVSPPSPSKPPAASSAGSTGASPTQPNRWLTTRLYGSDNDIAALDLVTIKPRGGGFVASIKNQFNFQCELTFDAGGNPEYLSNCRSADPPRPVCDPNMPDSLCAKSAGCFQSKDEKNSKCFESWEVKESRIRMECAVLRTEHVCTGAYTLSKGAYRQGGEFTLAHRL